MTDYADIIGWFDFPDLYTAQVARVTGPACFVEVGSFCGKSTAFLAETIQQAGKPIELHAYDTFEGVGAEYFTSTAEYARLQMFVREHGSLENYCRANLAGYESVSVRALDSLSAAARYADESLDFVFLDDDHSEGHVSLELDAWWPKVKPGGVMAGHDADWDTVQRAVEHWACRRGRKARCTSERCWAVKKATPITSWVVPAPERRCLVSICTNLPSMPTKTAESLMHIGWGRRVAQACEANGFRDILLSFSVKYPRVDSLRDDAALTALKADCSHILFLDADMTWPDDVLLQMLKHHHLGIVSGLYHLKTWPHWPVALTGGHDVVGRESREYEWDETPAHAEGLVAEDVVGMGCTLVPVSLFERMERPWFHYRNDAKGFPGQTEDVAFCDKARALGCGVYVDPSVVCGHLGLQEVSTPWFDRGLAEKRMLERDQRLKVRNDGVVVRPARRSA